MRWLGMLSLIVQSGADIGPEISKPSVLVEAISQAISVVELPVGASRVRTRGLVESYALLAVRLSPSPALGRLLASCSLRPRQRHILGAWLLWLCSRPIQVHLGLCGDTC